MVVKSYLSQMLNPVAVFSVALVLSLSGFAFSTSSWGMAEENENGRTCSPHLNLPVDPQVREIEEKLQNFVAFLNNEEEFEKANRNEDWSQDTVLSAILVLRLAFASASKEQATTLLDLPDETLLNIIKQPGVSKTMALVCKRLHWLSWDRTVRRGIFIDTNEKLENFIAFIDDEAKFRSFIEFLDTKKKLPLPYDEALKALPKALEVLLSHPDNVEHLRTVCFYLMISHWKFTNARNNFLAQEQNKDKEWEDSIDFKENWDGLEWKPLRRFRERFKVIKVSEEASSLMSQKISNLEKRGTAD